MAESTATDRERPRGERLHRERNPRKRGGRGESGERERERTEAVEPFFLVVSLDGERAEHRSLLDAEQQEPGEREQRHGGGVAKRRRDRREHREREERPRASDPPIHDHRYLRRPLNAPDNGSHVRPRPAARPGTRSRRATRGSVSILVEPHRVPLDHGNRIGLGRTVVASLLGLVDAPIGIRYQCHASTSHVGRLNSVCQPTGVNRWSVRLAARDGRRAP